LTEPSQWADRKSASADPKKGWFTILRLYGPLQSFLDKTWGPGEIESLKQ
jgi:hypothetical protein